jgi:predicted deacylase
VKLGAMIEAGQNLGKVFDTLGESPVLVPASKSGIVVVLRSCPSVKNGDSLATIIDVNESHRPVSALHHG